MSQTMFAITMFIVYVLGTYIVFWYGGRMFNYKHNPRQSLLICFVANVVLWLLMIFFSNPYINIPTTLILYWIIFFTAFGEELVLFIVLPIFYWVFNKEVSHIVAVSSFASMAVNGVIKDLAQVERPIGNPDIRFVAVDNFLIDTVSLKEGSYSFPSGHSQTISTMMFGISFFYNKKKLWIVSTVLVLLVMLSRMYLGVHWPLDVLVGGALGLVFAFAGYKLLINKSMGTRIKIYFIVALASVFLLIFANKSDTYKAIGACFGFALGALFEYKYVNFVPKEGTVIKKVLRCILGLVILLILKEGLKPLFGLIGDYNFLDFLRYAIIIFVAIGFYPFIFKKLKL